MPVGVQGGSRGIRVMRHGTSHSIQTIGLMGPAHPYILAQREQCARCTGPRRISICAHGDISTVTVIRLLEIEISEGLEKENEIERKKRARPQFSSAQILLPWPGSRRLFVARDLVPSPTRANRVWRRGSAKHPVVHGFSESVGSFFFCLIILAFSLCKTMAANYKNRFLRVGRFVRS